MKQPGIIRSACEFHRGYDVPFMKREKKTKENREQNKHSDKDKVGRDK